MAFTGKGGSASSAGDDADFFAGQFVAEELDGGGRVAAFQKAERDLPAQAFAVRLKIKQQHRITRLRQEFRAGLEHRPVSMDAVHQHHRAPAGRASHKPTADESAAGTGELHVFGVETGRRRADGMIRRRHQHRADVPKQDEAEEDSSHGKRAENSPSPGKFHCGWTPVRRRCS
jgi:hypothetical protein